MSESALVTGNNNQITIINGQPAIAQPSGYRCMATPPEGFIPREELDQIRNILCGDGASAVGITSALRGAGGFGKTTLAQALCFDDRVRAAYPDGILWTTISDQASESDLLSRVLDLIRWWTWDDPPHFDTLTVAAAHLREVLAGLRVLVVVDDAWSVADVEPFRRGGGGLLVTTRIRETLPHGCECVDVDAMRLEEAVRLLMADLPGAEGFQPRFEDLAVTLGEWPLLLKLVNGTLLRWVRRGLGIERALDEVAQAGLEDFDRRDSTAREKAVSRTMEVSLRHLSDEERRRYEALAIFPEDENIPMRILERWWACSAPAVRELSLLLHDLSLLRDLNLDAGTLRLHDVFRKYLIGQQGGAIAVLHQEFLTRSRPASSRWTDLPASESYIWRWLPYHLVQGGQSETLRDLLIDVRFLAARLQATDVNVVIAGFDHLPGIPDLRMVQIAIRLSAHILVRHPEQLPGQLLGRLPEGSAEGESQYWKRLRQETRTAGEQLSPRGSGLLPRHASLTPVNGPLLRTFEGHDGRVTAIAVIGERQALSGSFDGTLRLWDLWTGACLHVFGEQRGGITAVAAVGEGRALSGSADGTLCLWDLCAGACLNTFTVDYGGVTALAVMGEERALAGSRDGTLHLWDLRTGTCLRTFKVDRWRWHGVGVTALAAVGEDWALAGSTDGKLHLWDLQKGYCLRTFAAHYGGVTAVVAIGEGRVLSGSRGKLRLWNPWTGALLRTFNFKGPGGRVTAVAAVGQERALSGGTSDGKLSLWDLREDACLRTFAAHGYGVTAVAAAGEDRALSGSSDGTLRLWDLGEDASLRGEGLGVTAVAAVGERWALSGSRTTLCLWDPWSGACLHTFKGHSERVAAVTVVGKGRALSGSRDGVLRLWDLWTGTCLRTFEGQGGRVLAVTAVGEDRVLSGSRDGILRLWDLESGTCLRTFERHRDRVTAVAAVGEGRVLSSSFDRTLRLWDLETGACRHTFEGHSNRVTAVAVVGEGRVLSSSWDWTVRLWDLATGACLLSFEEHGGPVLAVAAVGKRRALSGGADKTVRLWDLGTGDCLAVFTFDYPVMGVAVLNGIVIVRDAGGNLHFLDLILPGSDPV